MVVLVVRGFADETVGAYRGRIDPKEDVEELLSEMIFADLEQVTARVGKLELAMRKPTGKRDEQQRELDLMRRLCETLENEKPVADAINTETEGKIVRSFAFLSQKPVLGVLNCGEDQAAQAAPDQLADLHQQEPSLRAFR